MPLTIQQKNIVIEYSEMCINSLNRLEQKITTRKNKFIKDKGGKIGFIQKDPSKLSKSELQTKLITLSKLHCELSNIDSVLILQIKQTDKEITKRNG